MCSDRLIATPIACPPELHFGQEVLYGDLQCLHYGLVDMHKLSLKIQEVMEFQKRLSILEEFFQVWNSKSCRSVWTPVTNTSRPQ
jgi:hypothetical protein